MFHDRKAPGSYGARVLVVQPNDTDADVVIAYARTRHCTRKIGEIETFYVSVQNDSNLEKRGAITPMSESELRILVATPRVSLYGPEPTPQLT